MREKLHTLTCECGLCWLHTSDGSRAKTIEEATGWIGRTAVPRGIRGPFHQWQEYCEVCFAPLYMDCSRGLSYRELRDGRGSQDE